MILHAIEAGPASNPAGTHAGVPAGAPTGIPTGTLTGTRSGLPRASTGGSSNGTLGAPAVVLLHGLFGQARNFGQIHRALAQRWRVLALDLRNHGASPHAPDMRYATMAEDVLETLAALGAQPAALIGHSMGGKVAMRAALLSPDAVERLLVADIAPVVYPPHNQPMVDAMLSVPLHDGLTRLEADAALRAAVPEASVRAFLLQNLRLGTPPAWRIGLNEIEAAMADIEGWDGPVDASREGATDAGATNVGATYAGRTLFVAGETSNYIHREDRPVIRALFPAARFVTVKRAGHWLHADNPAGFLGVVEAFLSAPQVR
jgi:esterase